MSNEELFALAVVVQSRVLGMDAVNKQRIFQDQSIGYWDDSFAVTTRILEEELKKRGIET